MATRATALNPAVLRWAREQAGMTVEDAAARISKSPDDLVAWEAGERFPTYNQLEALAERVYHRPVALFFLPEPPEEHPPASEFRTLPEPEKASLDADTLLALRERGWPVADPFIVARAMTSGGCVVTEEEWKKNGAKIPNVCEHFGVEWTNLEGLMDREGWRF